MLIPLLDWMTGGALSAPFDTTGVVLSNVGGRKQLKGVLKP